jgi:hypothetical protein
VANELAKPEQCKACGSKDFEEIDTISLGIFWRCIVCHSAYLKKRAACFEDENEGLD